MKTTVKALLLMFLTMLIVPYIAQFTHATETTTTPAETTATEPTTPPKEPLTREDMEEFGDKWREDFLNTFTPVDNFSWGFADTPMKIANEMWRLVGWNLSNSGNSSGVYSRFGISDFNAFLENSPVRYVFQMFAYGLVAILFGVGVMETALQNELMTAKGALKTFGRLLLAKFWIDMSTTICFAILGTSNGLLQQIITEANSISIAPNINISQTASNIPIVGQIVDLLTAIVLIFPMLLVGLTIIIIGGIVQIKLIIRTFEIAMMLIVAPVFFACWVGESSKQYFKKFIMNFIAVTFNIVFMAVVYVIGLEMLSQQSTLESHTDFAAWFLGIGVHWFISIVAIGIMMIKPPRVLTSLID